MHPPSGHAPIFVLNWRRVDASWLLTKAVGAMRARGRGRFRSFRGRGKGQRDFDKSSGNAQLQGEETSQLNARFDNVRLYNDIDRELGFDKYTDGPSRVGWLINMHPTTVRDAEDAPPRSAVDYYFIQDDGHMFKCTKTYDPYFYIACKKGCEAQVEEWIHKKFEGMNIRHERHRKEDLKLPNHLVGNRRTYLQLVFENIDDLLSVRKEILAVANKNREKLDAVDAYAEVVGAEAKMEVDLDPLSASTSDPHAARNSAPADPSDYIIDIREYDIPYYLRVAIDNEIRVGLWYTVTATSEGTTFKCVQDRVERPDPVVMAFDIETTKAPLKFPDSTHDQIMMISYMIDGQGFLITNREIVSEDINDFEYTPKPELEGPFVIFNESDERSVIRRFFDHFREAQPTVIATYNGDSFDFPFVCSRASVHGLDMYKEIGFAKDSEDEFKSRNCSHMDCFRWVKRDSYLPQGSQGLKAVTVAKLGYDPMELDPELMTPYAVEKPQTLAQYSVSDAVATYYLYMQYVHPFIFSLCNIIPLNPDEVLRKGTGTLCETLLMVEAFKGEIIMPNRHVEPQASLFEGHLLESETYVGGHVEALEAGVFREDIPTDFRIHPPAVQKLIDELDDALKFSLVEEAKIPLEDVLDYDLVKQDIQKQLEELRDKPLRSDKPLIYHLDVAAMYPNIMLSNRLQPDAIVDEETCAACDYNRPGKSCDRRMTWAWRGEFFPAKLDEYKMVRNALEHETFPPKRPNEAQRHFGDLNPAEQTSLVHKRLGDYSKKVYHKMHETKIVYKESIICQRENPFYIDTVRNFRDRRYVYKGLHKTWKKNLDKAQEKGSLSESVEAKKMIVLYDSLQLAHKCILNSFYGYVMRKGARWHSMEMAGITCLTGASIIQMARQIVEHIGRPLELDTDGIWCMLPCTFPDTFSFKLRDGKKHSISYPCSMLNHLVHAQFTNEQYHELTDPTGGTYNIRKENSVFFELDGPYRAMILPSSKEEDKLLKKRYAVFNEDGSLAELKGFEVKRRGELQLIKIFQSQIFERFLGGTDLQSCYASVANVANQWLDVLTTKAANLHDDELVDLIAENRSMSKTLAEYAGQKSTSISTARRLAEFLGNSMTKDKGLACKFIISTKPLGAPVTERALPVAIFSAEENVKRHYLRKWLKDNSHTDFSLRGILDWDYYIERLGSVIQKLITIPAAMQKVNNPVPRIKHPDWLLRRVTNLEDRFRQHRISDMFGNQQRRKEIEQSATDESFVNSDPASRRAELEALHKQKSSRMLKASGRSKRTNEIPTGPAPDIDSDFPGWLRYMRPIWRKRRQEMLARDSSTSSRSAAGNSLLGSMIRNQTDELSIRAWDIVQICDIPGRPGEFKLWLLIKDTLQAIRVKVPRVFYVNIPDFTHTNFPESAICENVVKTLPRSQQTKHLIKITADEYDFTSQSSKYSFLTDQPEVLGSYETQVSLYHRILIKLGANCKMSSKSKTTLSKALDKGFLLDDLEADSRINTVGYLNRGSNNMRYVYIYHATSDLRHICAIFRPNSNKARVMIVDRSGTRQVPNLSTYYSEQLEQRRRSESAKGTTSSKVFEYPEDLQFELTVHSGEEAAFRVISRELANVRSERGSGPTMLIACVSQDKAYYEALIGTAMSYFPCVQIKPSRSDATFRALGWQENSAKRMIQHYLRVSAWVKSRITAASKYNIPLCNLEQDTQILAADIDFARRLTKADVLLWWSPSSRPDLGGREHDANLQQLSEDLPNPETSKPGCYSNACVDMELRDLAINSLIQSAHVYDREGTDGGSLGFTEASHNLDEYAKGTVTSDINLGDAELPTQILSLLKSMVRSWVSEGAKADGRNHRSLVDHFWRWISSSSSALFDPAIHLFIHNLMRKTFSQLVSEFRRLGSEVVYGSFSRIIISTNKPSAAAAYAYANYISSSVNSRDLFKLTSLEIINFYEQLIWMDPANQAMIIDPDPTITNSNSGGSDDDDKLISNVNFNLVLSLPVALQRKFDQAVELFLDGIRQIHIQSHGDSRTPLRIIQNANETVPDPNKKKEVELGRDFLSRKFTRKMLNLVEKLTHSHANADAESIKEWEFPKIPGSLIDRTRADPVLEFIKTICGVMSLSRELVHDVQILKRNMLGLIGVREFAKEAAYQNPVASFKLPTRVCQHCTATREFDLVQDPDIAVPGAGPRTRRVTWSCQKCGNPFDMNGIEACMIEMAYRLVTAVQLQDLKCKRCKTIKATNLSLYCSCSGTFETTMSSEDVKQRLRIMSAVADYHGLRMAREAVEGLVKS